VKVLAVNVDTNNGVVTLTGQGATDADRQAAELVAKDTAGKGGVERALKTSFRCR
jgi:osmotically-inducible protein OsmY